MKPFFTIHAGEYLTGEFIEQKLRDPNVNRLILWINLLSVAPETSTGLRQLNKNHSIPLLS